MADAQSPELFLYADASGMEWQQTRPGSRRKILYSDGATGKLTRECPANGGLRRVGGTLVLVGVWLKKLAEPGAECSIEDCTANLEQEIGPSA